jgi:S1-C subfamily serine protease
MPYSSVEQGIAAIQAGNIEEGARLLKIALREPDIAGPMRAIACLWLAETTADPQTKRIYYNDALDADPGNAQVRQRVDAWMATQMLPPPPGSTPGYGMPPVTGDTGRGGAVPPPPPSIPGAGNIFQPQTVPVQTNPYAPQQPAYSPVATPQPGSIAPVAQPAVAGGMYRIAAIIGGPNGPGTAFFIAREGLLATTRYVVGGLDQVDVQLETGKLLKGFVVRAFPEVDLVFIYVEQATNDLIPFTPLPTVPDNMALTVVSANGQVANGRQRKTKRVLAPQWFPTDITVLPDAGGCPVLDDKHYLVGMITRNTTSTSSYVFGLHINAIRQYMETFRQESMGGGRVYCPHCGYYSQAAAAGGYYCEICGGIAIQAEQLVRFRQPQTDRFYLEHSNFTCMYCGATAGAHKGACLRCGQMPGSR